MREEEFVKASSFNSLLTFFNYHWHRKLELSPMRIRFNEKFSLQLFYNTFDMKQADFFSFISRRLK